MSKVSTFAARAAVGVLSGPVFFEEKRDLIEWPPAWKLLAGVAGTLLFVTGRPAIAGRGRGADSDAERVRRSRLGFASKT